MAHGMLNKVIRSARFLERLKRLIRSAYWPPVLMRTRMSRPNDGQPARPLPAAVKALRTETRRVYSAQ